MQHAIRADFAKRMNVNTCADPMTYPGTVHIQAIDAWTLANDCTDCDVMAAVSETEFDLSAERFEATSARIRGSPRSGDFGLVWRIAKLDKE